MFSEFTYEIIAGIMCVLNAERNTQEITKIIIGENIRAIVHDGAPLPISIISKGEIKQQPGVHFNENKL
jgi:hypothetical protein